MEAAQAWHVTPAQWRAQSPDDRARMMAHEFLKNLRQSYVLEQQKAKSEGKSPGGDAALNDYEKMKLQFGLR